MGVKLREKQAKLQKYNLYVNNSQPLPLDTRRGACLR